ncbi:basic proline-rich protein-like isoform X1 [Gorilla gorilla gorilla]|uniref:basic proline-rich protein-like isoform X1 n=1 Tax=Gorilla gorilla gorilla TaxID=9595 RepID=UPI003008DCF3
MLPSQRTPPTQRGAEGPCGSPGTHRNPIPGGPDPGPGPSRPDCGRPARALSSGLLLISAEPAQTRPTGRLPRSPPGTAPSLPGAGAEDSVVKDSDNWGMEEDGAAQTSSSALESGRLPGGVLPGPGRAATERNPVLGTAPISQTEKPRGQEPPEAVAGRGSRTPSSPLPHRLMHWPSTPGLRTRQTREARPSFTPPTLQSPRCPLLGRSSPSRSRATSALGPDRPLPSGPAPVWSRLTAELQPQQDPAQDAHLASAPCTGPGDFAPLDPRDQAGRVGAPGSVTHLPPDPPRPTLQAPGRHLLSLSLPAPPGPEHLRFSGRRAKKKGLARLTYPVKWVSCREGE